MQARNRTAAFLLSLFLTAAAFVSCVQNPAHDNDKTGTSQKESESTAKTKEDETAETEENMEMNQYPQYLSVHKIDQPGKNQWYMADPSSVNQSSFDEVINAVGHRGGNDRRLAISYTFEYAAFPLDNVRDGIENMLRLSEENDVPVILHLDGVNYWSYYPQLWNFWDSGAPGYDPENYKNVERFGWGEDTAVKIGWRNWGRQIRVAPAPNLASPAFLGLQRDCLSELFPVIAKWYDALPGDRKYLLGGIVLGWELSTYVQAYYYEGGNDLLAKPAADDPAGGLYESMPLGYAAALELGLQSDGIITEKTQDGICSFYMEYLIDLALEFGIDPTRIVTHSFYGGETKHGGGQSGAASISDRLTDGVVPGWSFYGERIYEIEHVVAMAGDYPWAAIEYKPWGLTWSILNQTFNYKKCRYINIYNWNAIRDDTKTLEILEDLLKDFK